eukprot:2184649-Prymnesium_polylepis.2
MPPPECAQTYQHLTVCTHTGLVVYLILSVACEGDRTCDGDSWRLQARNLLRAVGFPLTAVVGIGFWTLALASPTKLLAPPWTMLPREDFPKDDVLASQLARRLLWPTWHPLLVVCICFIHLQHTAMPLYPWLEDFLYPEGAPVFTAATEICALLACAFAWIIWAIPVCWLARGQPPYPVLRAVWHDSSWPRFYATFFALGLSMVCAGRAYRGR